jgi:hypothetical protein
MTTFRCPNCGMRPTTIAYGLPDERLMDEVRRGRVVLGGCVVGEDDPREACRHCGAVLWGYGVFSIDDDLRVRLGVPSHRMEAMLADDGTLWLSDDSGMATMPADDADLVMMMSLIEVFDDAEALQRWLDRRRISYSGEASGMLGHVVIADEGEKVLVWAESGELVVESTIERFTLHLLRDLVRTLRFRSVDDVAGYFEAHGGAVTRSPVPVG